MKNLDSIFQKINAFVECHLCPLREDNIFYADQGVLLDRNGILVGLNLNKVGLSDEKLCNLIESDIDFFGNLLFLDVSNNKLKAPLIIGSLMKLEKLIISDNGVTEIGFLSNLVRLVKADFSCNQIELIPDAIFRGNLDVKLTDDYTNGLILEGNLLKSSLLADIERKVADQKAERLEKLLKNGVYSRNECRIQLIGTGGAGKTTLAKSLANGNCNSNEPATRGMAIWDAQLNHIRLKIWDFGGQEAMFSAHRLFIAGGDIFLIVLDSRHNESAEGWIEFVLAFAPKANFIIVMNKIDENKSFDLDRGSLRQKYPDQILEFFRISANNKSNSTFVEFKERLEEILTPFAKTELPTKFKPFLKEIEGDNSPFNYVEEYKKRFLRFDLVEKNFNLALDQLVLLGIVIRAKLTDYGPVLISSKWLARNMYPLLEPDIAFQDCVKNGVISEANLFNIWKKHRSTHLIQPDNAEHDDAASHFAALVDVMQKSSLCYRVQEASLFVPNFLEANSPNLSQYIPAGEQLLHFVFKCSFLPKLVFQDLHVEIGKSFNVNNRWRSGFVVKGTDYDIKGDFTCIVEGNFFYKTISIKAYGEDRFSVFRDMYKSIRSSFGDKDQVSEFIVYSDPETGDSFHLSFDDLNYHQKQKVDKYYCGKYRRTFSVEKVMNGVPEEIVEQEREQYFNKEEKLMSQNTIYNFHGGSNNFSGSAFGTKAKVINMADLSEQLSKLRDEILNNSGDNAKMADNILVAIEALNNNQPKEAVVSLEKVRKWALASANTLGLAVAAKEIQSLLGF